MRDNISRKQQTLHSAWRYTRIERVPGRAVDLAMSESNSDEIDEDNGRNAAK